MKKNFRFHIGGNAFASCKVDCHVSIYRKLKNINIYA